MRTRAIADKAIAEGLTPLEVMLKAMRTHADKDERDEAASIAKDAAPYMHAKLASVQHTGPRGGPIQTVDLTKLSCDEPDQLKRIFGALPDLATTMRRIRQERVRLKADEGLAGRVSNRAGR